MVSEELYCIAFSQIRNTSCCIEELKIEVLQEYKDIRSKEYKDIISNYQDHRS